MTAIAEYVATNPGRVFAWLFPVSVLIVGYHRRMNRYAWALIVIAVLAVNLRRCGYAI